MTPADIEKIEHAAALLDGNADYVKLASDKAGYDDMKKASAELYALAERERAKG